MADYVTPSTDYRVPLRCDNCRVATIILMRLFVGYSPPRERTMSQDSCPRCKAEARRQ